MNEQLFKKVSEANLKTVMELKGYKYFERGVMNLNLIGVRAQRENNENKDTFDGLMVVTYKDHQGQWQKFIHSMTTVPGVRWMQRPGNNKGVAILKPGQYPGVWKIDYHRGKYLALCQRGNAFVVYRDNNRDTILDFDEVTEDYGYFGINYHKAGANSLVIGANSAGCQVAQRSADFDKVMGLATQSSKIYGNSFTYTLLEEEDF